VQKLLDKIADGTFSEFFDDWKWIFVYSKCYKWFVLLYTLLGLFAFTTGVASSYVSAIRSLTGGR